MNSITSEQNDLKLALVQFQPEWEAPDNSRHKLDALFEGIDLDVDVIILPEAFSTGFSMNAEKMAEPMNGNTVNWMKQVAERKNTVMCGSLFIEEDGRYYNRFVWIEPNGKLTTYDKRHLFSIGAENKNYSSGNRQVIIEYKGWRIFPQICYDLRFPVWSRNVFNYDLLINVASWPAPRYEVWQTLLKARAIENQCYVAAVNRVGVDGNNVAHRGDSMLIDAKGKVLQDARNAQEIFYQTLSLNSLKEFRSKFDTLSDRDQFEIQL